MNTPDTGHDRLQEILGQAYREKEEIIVGDQWQDEVMRRVRELGPIQSTPRFAEFLEQFIWRLAPAACLLILALTALLIFSDFSSEYELYQMLMNGIEEQTFAQLFGL